MDRTRSHLGTLLFSQKSRPLSQLQSRELAQEGLENWKIGQLGLSVSAARQLSLQCTVGGGVGGVGGDALSENLYIFDLSYLFFPPHSLTVSHRWGQNACDSTLDQMFV